MIITKYYCDICKQELTETEAKQMQPVKIVSKEYMACPGCVHYIQKVIEARAK